MKEIDLYLAKKLFRSGDKDYMSLALSCFSEESLVGYDYKKITSLAMAYEMLTKDGSDFHVISRPLYNILESLPNDLSEKIRLHIIRKAMIMGYPPENTWDNYYIFQRPVEGDGSNINRIYEKALGGYIVKSDPSIEEFSFPSKEMLIYFYTTFIFCANFLSYGS